MAGQCVVLGLGLLACAGGTQGGKSGEVQSEDVAGVSAGDVQDAAAPLDGTSNPGDSTAGGAPDGHTLPPTKGNGITLLSDCTSYAGTGSGRCDDSGTMVLGCVLVEGAYKWAAGDTCSTSTNPGQQEVCWETKLESGKWEAECGCPTQGATACDASSTDEPVLYECRSPDCCSPSPVAPQWEETMTRNQALWKVNKVLHDYTHCGCTEGGEFECTCSPDCVLFRYLSGACYEFKCRANGWGWDEKQVTGFGTSRELCDETYEACL